MSQTEVQDLSDRCCGETVLKVVVVGGVPRSLIGFRGQLLGDMVSGGHEVAACAYGNPEDVVTSLTEMGVTYQQIFLERTGTNPLHDIRTLSDLKKLFEQLRPDCVLLYTIKPVIYGSLAANYAHVPRVFSMITGLGYAFGDSSFKQRLIGFPVQMLYRTALTRNNAVFFQNPDDQELFVRKRLVPNPDKAVLINGSGVDLTYYQDAPPVTDKISFLLIARLIRDKGIYEYVQAARQLKQRYPNVVFRLLGPFDSNPTAIHQQTIEEWQDEGAIEYLGRTRDVRPYIADCSVYVLPSYREGTPRTVLEAMAMGRPIVTTDTPGCRETVVDGKNGYLVPVKDVEELVRALERFILRPELIPRMGQESRRIAVEKYDVRKVNETILRTMGLL